MKEWAPGDVVRIDERREAFYGNAELLDPCDDDGWRPIPPGSIIAILGADGNNENFHYALSSRGLCRIFLRDVPAYRITRIGD